MKTLQVYIREKKEETRQDIFEKSPFYKKNMHFGTGLSLGYFLKYFELNKPIVGGNWNPRDFISNDQLNTFLDWCKENNPNYNDELYVIFGSTYEGDDNNVDVGKLYSELINNFGDPTGGGSVRASCFGRIGIGPKYYANHYFGNGEGGLIEHGGMSPNGKIRTINWVLFLKQEWFDKFGLIADKNWEEANEEANKTGEFNINLTGKNK